MARRVIVLEDEQPMIQDLGIDLRDNDDKRTGGSSDRVLNVFVKQTKGRTWRLTAIVERMTSS